MDITEVRKLFPHLSNGFVYLNHASTGPVSTLVKDRVNSLMKEKSENKIDDYEEFLKTVEGSKEILSEMINSQPERIAFTDNTSNGLNHLAQSINWKPGERILLNDSEFPANVYPFLNLKNKGVEIDFVRSESGFVSADDIIHEIKDQTKLISVSFVQFLTGYRIELEKIGKICKERNIIFSVDAIQGLGAFRLDVQKCNIDFLSCGTQKWLLGFQGLAFIFISRSLQEKINPVFAGWLSVDNAWDLLNYTFNFKKSANIFQTGTLNQVGIYGFFESLKLFKGFGFQSVEKSILNNTNYLSLSLKEIGISTVLSEVSEENLSGIVTFKIENPKQMQKEFEKKKITFSEREGFVRLAPHFYNTKDDINILLAELKNYLNL